MAERSAAVYLKSWLKEMFTFNVTQGRWGGTFKRVLGILVPMFIMFLAFGPEAGLVSMVGSTTPVKVSNGMPIKPRVKSLLAFSIATSICMGLGAMTTVIPWSIVPMIFFVAFASTFIYHAIFSGPPGPIDLILAAALGAYIVGHHHFDPYLAVVITFLAAILSSLISLADVFLNPLKPELNATADAIKTVDQYIEFAASYNPHDTADVSRLSRLKYDATRRISRAWNYIEADEGLTLINKTERSVLKDQLEEAHIKFARAMEKQEHILPNFDSQDIEIGALGSPGITYRIKTAMNVSSLPFFAALRIAIACSIAAFVVEALHVGHAYWAVLTAAALLHMFPDRLTSVKKATFQIVGEFIGLILYALMIPFIQTPEQAFAVVAVLLFINDWITPKNAPLGITAMTPLALLVSTLGHVGAEPTQLIISTRAFETLVGIAVSLFAIYFIGRSAPIRLVRAQYELLMDATSSVLAQMSVGRMDSDRGLRTRNVLQYELMRTSTILGNAQKDSTDLQNWVAADRAANDLGFATFWMSWNDEDKVIQSARDALHQVTITLDELPDKGENTNTDNLVNNLCRATAYLTSTDACRLY